MFRAGLGSFIRHLVLVRAIAAQQKGEAMSRTSKGIASVFFTLFIACAPYLVGIGAALHTSATEASGNIVIGNFSVDYPDGWSTLQSGQLTVIVNVTADQQASLGAQYVFTPQVQISTEQRLDDNDALKQLDEIAASAGASVRRLTVDGFPAVQWRKTRPWPQARGGHVPAGGSALTVNTAIAAGNQLIRLYGSLPADAPSTLADAIASIETSVHFSAASSKKATAVRPQLTTATSTRKTIASASGDDGDDGDDEFDMPPPVSEGSPSASLPAVPGVASRLLQGTAASEPEVAVSSNGRNIVVAQQFVWTYSNNGGLTFTFGGSFPNSTGGDSSLAVGASGNFYEGTIFNNTTAIHRSTDNGATFTVRGTAFICGALPQCNFTGNRFPDQEHIAADRTNQVNNQDQVYSVFRNGSANPTWGIVCSTDGGANWTAGNVGIAGDFPRVAVAGDGSVYVAFVDNANNVRINKFASCNTNGALPALAGWPRTVAAGITELPCPVPGLDRCNNGNTLRGPTVAVDDNNNQHVFYAYATNTAAGNENVVIHDSTDGGQTFSTGTTLNGGGNARRYMPWMCVTKGTAFVSWYDRRNATAADNDLTDYFGASATRSGGVLQSNGELQLNDAATSDAQCEGGQTVGSQRSWPGGSRAVNDSEGCSRQPQLAGVCGTGACGAGGACPAGQTCDAQTNICRRNPQQFCDFSTTACGTGDTCQLWGGGIPKYGDYNGNACAQGHLYAVWASATPARAVNPGIDLFFKVIDTVTPIASCKNVTTQTDAGLCSASGVSIDNGSTDPDNDTFTLTQSPPNPYPKGVTNVKLTITDQNNQTNSCNANVTVNDLEKPNITCLTPKLECTSPAGAVVAKLIDKVSDNCAILSKGCTPPEGSTFPLGVDPFTCTATDTSSNSQSCSSTVTVTDTTPPVIKSIVANPSSLWPPNHQYVPVSIVATATDVCDAAPKCRIDSVTSSEPTLTPGSGNTTPDWIIDNPGPKASPAQLGVQLRAERSGPNTGRIYTINVSCRDASGNASTGTTAVTVDHDQGM
jgi:hypothetical protein